MRSELDKGWPVDEISKAPSGLTHEELCFISWHIGHACDYLHHLKNDAPSAANAVEELQEALKICEKHGVREP